MSASTRRMSGVPDGILESQALECGAQGAVAGVTTRNWATLQRIHALMMSG